MALQLRNLCVTAYANGWTLWRYDAKGDRIEDVLKYGYFDDTRGLLKRGDAGYISCSDGLLHVCWTHPGQGNVPIVMSAARFGDAS